jgi:hypothetical protein
VSTSDTVAVDHPVDPRADHDPARRRDLSARLALLAFAAYLVIAFFVLRYKGRGYWFYSDEWQLLIRNLNSPADYFRPLNQHWLTLPLLAMRLLFWTFGLTYGPFQSVVILMHLGLVVLLRWIMRRAGVSPWFSTIAAGTLVLFGSGYMNILQVIQISLVGSALFGIGHLLCADHDGGFTRRDALGLGLGALGVMTSGLGTVMVVIVGIAVLIRRGWRLALVHTVPLVLLNGVWYLAERKGTSTGHATEPLAHGINWVSTGERTSFEAFGGSWFVAVALAAMLVVGLVLAWRPLTRAELRRQAAVPAALLLGGPVMFWLVSAQRYWLAGEVDSPKFFHLAMAFALPALAIAANAIARQWRVLTPVAAIVLLAGVPGNIGKFPYDGPFQPGFFHSEKVALLGTAYSDRADDVPPGLMPMTAYFSAPGVTMGWLLDAKAAGRLPKAPALTQKERDEVFIRLAVMQRFKIPPAPGAPPQPDFVPARVFDCRLFFRALTYRNLPVGSHIVVNDWVSINYGQASVPIDPAAGSILEVRLPNVTFTVNNVQNSPNDPVTVCH